MISQLDSEDYGLHDKLHLFLELCLGRIRRQISKTQEEVKNARTEVVGCCDPKITHYREWREKRTSTRILRFYEEGLSSLELEEARYDNATRQLLYGNAAPAIKLLDRVMKDLPYKDNYWAPIDADAVRVDELKAFARRVYQLMGAQSEQGH